MHPIAIDINDRVDRFEQSAHHGERMEPHTLARRRLHRPRHRLPRRPARQGRLGDRHPAAARRGRAGDHRRRRSPAGDDPVDAGRDLGVLEGALPRHGIVRTCVLWGVPATIVGAAGHPLDQRRLPRRSSPTSSSSASASACSSRRPRRPAHDDARPRTSNPVRRRPCRPPAAASRSPRGRRPSSSPAPSATMLALVAVIVGVSAGLLANSGGFLLAPLMMTVVKLPIRPALATSLAVSAVLADPRHDRPRRARAHRLDARRPCSPLTSVPLSFARRTGRPADRRPPPGAPLRRRARAARRDVPDRPLTHVGTGRQPVIDSSRLKPMIRPTAIPAASCNSLRQRLAAAHRAGARRRHVGRRARAPRRSAGCAASGTGR